MANLLETSEIKRETVGNLISDQNTRDVIHRNRSFILECPNCKKKFYRRILLLQHREVHKRNRKLPHSVNKKKQRRRRLSEGPISNAAFNCVKNIEKSDCNNDITDNDEIVRAEHEKDASLECEIQPREEIKIELKDEFECSKYTLTSFTPYEVHIEKDSVVEDERKLNEKSEHEQGKRDQVKDNVLRPFQCEICDRKFARKHRLIEHWRIHTGEKPFKCKICFSGYRTKTSLIQHSVSQHPEDNPYECAKSFECNVCLKKFLYKSNLVYHNRIHTGEKPYNCDVCQKRYWKKIDLVKHLKSHIVNKKDFNEQEENESLQDTVEYKLQIPVRKTVENLQITEICSKTYSNKHKLKTHLITHTGERPFKCCHCDARFNLTDSLRKHQVVHQVSDLQPFKCEICNKAFTQKGKLDKHLYFHTGEKPFECKICFSRFKTKLILVKHSVTQHPENSPYECKQTFECDACQKKFLYKSDFLNHKRIHTRDKPFNCAVCQKGYWKKPDLVQHLKSHTGDGKDFVDDSEYPTFKCDICSKTFTQKGTLNQHLRSHTEERPFQCKICSLRFKTKLILVKHSITQHPDNNPYECKRIFECDVCQKKFLYKSDFFKHKKVHTRDSLKCGVYPYLVKHFNGHTDSKKNFVVPGPEHVEDSESPLFTCAICNKTFTQKEKITQHLCLHTGEKPFECKICFSKYKTKPNLIKHTIRQHPEDNPYKCKQIFECDVCQKKFLYKWDVLHHRKIHTREKPFNCDVCQKGYWKKLDFVQHLKSHTGDFVDDSEYPSFTCEVCNKTFTQKGKLTQHLRSHTDDRPFQCKICSLRFKTKPVLVKHSYRQHPEDNPYDCKKDYRCDICQKKFLYQSDLVYHRKKHTGDKPFSCDVCKKGFWKKPYYLKHLQGHNGKEREKDENLVLERCSEVVYMKDFADFENHDGTYAWIKEEKNENIIEPRSKVVFIKENLNYNNDLQDNEEVVLCTEHEKKASLRCEAQAKEEIKIEIKDEFECGEYTLQPFTCHSVHIENNGVEEYESKQKNKNVREERKYQVKKDVTDSENRNHGYTHEKQEEDNFTEPCLM